MPKETRKQKEAREKEERQKEAAERYAEYLHYKPQLEKQAEEREAKEAKEAEEAEAYQKQQHQQFIEQRLYDQAQHEQRRKRREERQQKAPPAPPERPSTEPTPSCSPGECVASGFRNLKTRGVRDKIVRGRGMWDMFKKVNRKMVKHVMVPGMDFTAGLIPALMGQPELTPFAVAGAHALGTAAQKPLLGALRSDKRQRNLDQREAQRREQEEEEEEYNKLMNKYKISGKGIMNQPRSRSVGSDMLSPMAAATMGHSQAMNMKLKLEKDMAMGRRKQIGLVGVSGNLLGPGASPALQSQPQQNFQFRHTISSPTYHPHVYGNGLYA